MLGLAGWFVPELEQEGYKARKSTRTYSTHLLCRIYSNAHREQLNTLTYHS